MDHWITRYLDGDLDEAETARFLEALETDSVLAHRLLAHERLIAAAGRLAEATPPIDLTPHIMQKVRATSESMPRRARIRRFGVLEFGKGLALAASLAIVFGIGRWSVRPETAPGAIAIRGDLLGPTILPARWVQDPAGSGGEAESGFVAVRLAYRPTDSDVRSVSVAGSFNGWNPRGIPLLPAGEVWTAVLVLPRNSYDYVFVEDGQRWVVDPHAPRTRDDGFGGKNAVLDLGV